MIRYTILSIQQHFIPSESLIKNREINLIKSNSKINRYII